MKNDYECDWKFREPQWRDAVIPVLCAIAIAFTYGIETYP